LLQKNRTEKDYTIFLVPVIYLVPYSVIYPVPYSGSDL
jgi:hypothetical protein